MASPVHELDADVKVLVEREYSRRLARSADMRVTSRFPHALTAAFVLAGCASSPRPRPAASTSAAADDFRCTPAHATSPALAALRPTFTGNARVPREHLECALGNALGDAPAPDDASRRELVERAEVLLHAIYYDLGFLDVRLTSSATDATARFEIREGDRFRVGAVTVRETDARGNVVEALGGDEALRRRVTLRRGEWFSRGAASRGIVDIQRHYRDAGYASVEINPDLRLQRPSLDADFVVTVRRGPLVTVERVEVNGGTRITPSALLDGFHPGAGELYNETALQTSRARLAANPRLERVDISSEAVPGRSDRIVLHVEVQERDVAALTR